jgi:hypothetical protein
LTNSLAGSHLFAGDSGYWFIEGSVTRLGCKLGAVIQRSTVVASSLLWMMTDLAVLVEERKRSPDSVSFSLLRERFDALV